MKTAVIYTRVSTERQAEEGVSLDAQLARLRAYAEHNGMEIIGEYCDAGVSGKSTQNRPEFLAALDLVCRRKAVLIFYSLSRISRSTKDLIGISERIQKCGAGLASLQEQIDTTTAMGSFLFTILAALASLERELIGERTRCALAHLKANGQVYGPAPYGYTATEDGRLLKHTEQQARMAQMYKWKTEEWLSYKEICDRLNAAGIPAKHGGVWATSALRRIMLEYKRRQEEKCAT